MNKLTVSIFAGVALFVAACGNNSSSDKASVAAEQQVAEQQGEVYILDLDTTNVSWKAFHKGGFAPRWGTLGIQSGELTVADDEITSGNFVIDMNSLLVDPLSVTDGDKKPEDLAGHLKNEDFFDTAKHPTAVFKITQIADLDADTDSGAVEGANKMVSGNLTLLDSTVNVSFPAKIAIVDGKASVTANFTVDRAAWGIKFGTSEADPAEWMISKDFEVGVAVIAAK
ncbi:YceI family protein [Parapedobacter tibetensis]|uniref:YceI family protein n=1 Tax=Parapedobacter tibetensis TaxID=2972951 RepID=UPI00214DC886|nr:YceI family protein [Parapedobacter tibetensis]